MKEYKAMPCKTETMTMGMLLWNVLGLLILENHG